jgi:peptidoglycan hydrolase-like protein with peptidoglycan-binding domain
MPVNNPNRSGELCIYAYEGFKTKPISNAKVSIYDANHILIESLITDSSGQTKDISLTTPDERSSEATETLPYTTYEIKVEAEGYNQVEIQGVQMFGQVKSIQEVAMTTETTEVSPQTPQAVERFIIPTHVLYGKYPGKEPEPLLTGMPIGVKYCAPLIYILPVLPEFVQVHAGPPTRPAPTYTVPYKDYIKNVACCEIIPSWHKEALKANIICIISFTLNRIQTEHYRLKGFTITSTTQLDHKYAQRQTVFQPISEIVDEIFDSYIQLPSLKQTPFLAQYSGGRKGSPNPLRPGWLSQWGSQYLAEKRGFNHRQILDYYYKNVLGTVTISNKVKIKGGIPETFPGHILKRGSTEKEVKVIQIELNTIAKNYPAIPKLDENGVFDEKTETAIKTFQKIVRLPQTGTVNRATWYKIIEYYVRIKKLIP